MTDVLARQQQERQRIAALQQQTGASTVPVTAQQQAASEYEYKKAQEDFDNKYIKLDNGEYIDREKYNALDAESKKVIMSKGVDAYNTYQQKVAEDNFAVDHVKLSDGNWVTKEYYESLPGEWGGYLRDKGIDGYKKWWDSKPYGDATTFYVIFNTVYVPTENPMIGKDLSGTRVYLGERWTEQAEKYSGSPKDINTAQLIASGKDLVPSQVTLPSLRAGPTENEKTYGNAFIAEHVKLNTGEWIQNTTLQNLDSKTREAVIKYGSNANIDNTYALKQIKEATGYADEIKNNPGYVYEYDAVKLKTGELIDNTAYKSLSGDLKNALDKGGFKEYEKVLAEKYIKLPDDNYISRDEYNQLSFTQKQAADQKGYEGLRNLQIEGESVVDKLNNGYRLGEGFDITGYLTDTGDIKGLVAAGFANKDIGDTISRIIKLPSKTEIKSLIDNINDTWQALTPWQEDNDENFISYIIDQYKDAENTKQGLEAKEGSKEWDDVQVKLKKIYDEEQNSPWWWKLLFGDSVIKDDNGNYTVLMKFQSPDIVPFGSPAARAAELSKLANKMKPYIKGTATISAKEVGMSEQQFARFIRFRVNNPESKLAPQAWKNWDDIMSRGILTVKNKLPESISQPNIKRAIKSTGSHLSGKRGQPAINKQLSEYTEKLLKEKGLVKETAIEQINKIPEKDLTSDQKLVKEAQRLYDEANKAVDEVVKNVSYGTAEPVNNAIIRAVNNGVATHAVAKNARQMVQAYTMASPAVQQILIKSLDTDTGNSIIKGNVAQAQTNAMTELRAQTKAKTIALAASKLAEKLAEEGKTAAEINNEVQQFAKAETNSIPDPSTRAEVKAIVIPVVQTIVQPVPQPAIKVQPGKSNLTKPKVDLTRKTTARQKKFPKQQKPKDEDNKKRKWPPPPPFLPKLGKLENLTSEQRKGLTAWKQGFMYVAIYPPYDESNTIYSREPLEGVKYQEGIGSAAKTIIAKIGRIPPHIQKDMGIMDITISRTKNETRPEIVFRLDRMQKTTYSGSKKTAGIKSVR